MTKGHYNNHHKPTGTTGGNGPQQYSGNWSSMASTFAPSLNGALRLATTAYSIRLSPGEPSRLAYEAIRTTISWSFYIYSKFAAEGESKLQVYPDRGPKQRAAKGKGKGKGTGKKGGEKGKGKGKRDQDNQEG